MPTQKQILKLEICMAQDDNAVSEGSDGSCLSKIHLQRKGRRASSLGLAQNQAD